MRRLALLAVGGAVWLFLAAIPVFADGGPHVAQINSGVGGISADSCAGCHRAHTAQGELLLQAPSEEALCLTCHGATGTGATTDVESGVQYTLAAAGQVRGGTILGALRGGGFVDARIASDSAARLAYQSGSSVRELPKVPVAASGEAVTSAHLDLDGAGGVATSGVVWGNGPISATANPGGSGTISCGTCHNPHGNGKYRILNPIPTVSEPNGFIVAPTGVDVTDGPAPAAGDTRNYTVIQLRDNVGTATVSQVVAGGFTATQGDYMRRRVPWNASTTGTYSADAPNGQAATFTIQMAQWCSQCHTRYLTGSGSYETDSGDAIFKYRHPTDSTSRNCITCHVAHGSNAQMTGVFSANQTNPGGTAARVGDSRLLKIDNRGTCQACHDPTGTITAGTLVGPTPVPLVP